MSPIRANASDSTRKAAASMTKATAIVWPKTRFSHVQRSRTHTHTEKQEKSKVSIIRVWRTRFNRGWRCRKGFFYRYEFFFVSLAHWGCDGTKTTEIKVIRRPLNDQAVVKDTRAPFGWFGVFLCALSAWFVFIPCDLLCKGHHRYTY